MKKEDKLIKKYIKEMSNPNVIEEPFLVTPPANDIPDQEEPHTIQVLKTKADEVIVRLKALGRIMPMNIKKIDSLFWQVILPVEMGLLTAKVFPALRDTISTMLFKKPQIKQWFIVMPRMSSKETVLTRLFIKYLKDFPIVGFNYFKLNQKGEDVYFYFKKAE